MTDGSRSPMRTMVVDRAPSAGDLRIVNEGVLLHGRALAAEGSAQPVACFLREAGAVIAGASGKTEYARLFVAYLWVQSEHRRQGIGTQVLQELERAAREDGCRDSLIETLDDGVASMYQGLGYAPVAVVRDYVGPFNRHILGKPL